MTYNSCKDAHHFLDKAFGVAKTEFDLVHYELRCILFLVTSPKRDEYVLGRIVPLFPSTSSSCNSEFEAEMALITVRYLIGDVTPMWAGSCLSISIMAQRQHPKHQKLTLAFIVPYLDMKRLGRASLLLTHLQSGPEPQYRCC